jgi:hypothetical protein
MQSIKKESMRMPNFPQYFGKAHAKDKSGLGRFFLRQENGNAFWLQKLNAQTIIISLYFINYILYN